MAEPPFSARIRVLGTEADESVCEVIESGAYGMRDSAGGFRQPVLSARWDTRSGELQFFLDGQPVCREPLASATAPQMGLYYFGAGLNLEITQLRVTLLTP